MLVIMSDNVSTKSDSQQSTDITTNTCANCHTSVSGFYCSQCGQSVESTLKYFWTVVLHLLDDVFSFDSRSSRTLWPLLTRPAFLTNEYILGRRVHYVPPIRLYLFISIIFFISLKFIADTDNGIIKINDESFLHDAEQHLILLKQKKTNTELLQVNKTPQASELNDEIVRFEQYATDLSKSENSVIVAMTNALVEIELKRLEQGKAFTNKQQKKYDAIIKQLSKIKQGEKIDLVGDVITFNKDGSFSFDFLSKENNASLSKYVDVLEKKANDAVQADPTQLITEAIGKLPQLMFILLPIFALLLKVIYVFSNRLYLEHLTVALHSHSFIFIIVMLIELLNYIQDFVFSGISFVFSFISVILLLWIPVYLFIMQKRIYRQGYLATTLKYILTGGCYSVLISFTAIVAFIWGLADS